MVPIQNKQNIQQKGGLDGMKEKIEMKEIRQIVYKKLESLLNMSKEEAAAKAVLAKMRRGVGHIPGELPELWGMLFEDMPEKMLNDNGIPSSAEWAVYIALTLFALHQQGHTLQKPMYEKGQSFGKAMRALARAENGTEDEEAFKRIRRRFNVIATSSDIQELAHHMKGAVQLLRNAEIALDYPQLAGELYLYQIPGEAARVRLCWGEKFYQNYEENEKKEG